MQTYFWREGRAVSYDELLEVLKQIIKSKVIDELAEEELDKLYVRIYDTAYFNVKTYLEGKNFKIINPRQGMLTASQVQLIEDKPLWDEAFERKRQIEEGCPSWGQSYAKGLKAFIKEDYYPALKKAGSKLCAPQFGAHEE